MRIHQLIAVTVFVLATTVFSAVPTRSGASTLSLPLTPREQAVRLWLVATPETAQKLFPSAEAAPKYYFQRDYRREYGGALLKDRARLAERIGEQGRARFAAERGWNQLLGSRNRGIRQGPDSVYWDRRTGVVRVIEAKGGNSKPTITYGSSQGTNPNTIRSAQRVLMSPNATRQARVAMARVIVAAQEDRLATAVVRTPHTMGRPSEPRIQGGWNRTNVGREALKIERDLLRSNSSARRIFQEARRNQSATMLKHRSTKVVPILGLVGSAGLAWDAFQQSRVAWGMFDDPTLKGTLLPHMQTGVAIGTWGYATTVGVSSAAQLGTINLVAHTRLVQAANAALLPVVLGLEGLRLATAYYEYNLGRISQRDLYRRTIPTAIAAGATTVGAIVGGVIALPAGGVTAGAGALAGAKIVTYLVIPVGMTAYQLWGWWYDGDSHVRRRRLVEEAVYDHYGRESATAPSTH